MTKESADVEAFLKIGSVGIRVDHYIIPSTRVTLPQNKDGIVPACNVCCSLLPKAWRFLRNGTSM